MTKKQRIAAAAPRMFKALKALVEDERPANWNDVSTVYARECRTTIRNWMAAEDIIEEVEGKL